MINDILIFTCIMCSIIYYINWLRLTYLRDTNNKLYNQQKNIIKEIIKKTSEEYYDYKYIGPIKDIDKELDDTKVKISLLNNYLSKFNIENIPLVNITSDKDKEALFHTLYNLKIKYRKNKKLSLIIDEMLILYNYIEYVLKENDIDKYNKCIKEDINYIKTQIENYNDEFPIELLSIINTILDIILIEKKYTFVLYEFYNK